nr:MAG: putative RNA-dependent RNA polymerase [Narnaviridae sp.]
MNNFQVIHHIDDILLNRLHAVAPIWEKRHDGPKQWLFISKPKISFETELVRVTTTLSVPLFPPSEQREEDGSYILRDGTSSFDEPPPRLMNGSLFPSLGKDEVFYSVDYRLVQAFSGLRSVLLVLIDSCFSCAQDPDFVGLLPASDSISVLSTMSSWSETDFVPNSKYWKDWPLARFLRNPLPPCPSTWKFGLTHPLFSGDTGKYFLRLATYDGTRDDSFSFYRAVFGLAQSKRGFAPVPVSFIKTTMQKHALQLSTPPISQPDLESVRIFAETFFKGFRCPPIFQALPSMEASTRASVESSRDEGGAREHLRRMMEDSSDLPLEEELFLGMREHSPGFVLEDRGFLTRSADQWRSLARSYTPSTSLSFLSPEIQQKVQRMIKKDSSLEDLPLARVAPVIEPLKVRLITAMDAVRGHVARPLQGALWRFLRSSPVFRLIGEPVTESIIHDLVLAHRKAGGKEDPFVSGDYSAATDGLDIRVSKVILEVILDHLDPQDLPFRDFLASALLEQILVYPFWTKIPPTVQKNGQLMGSVLSFPILCLANLFSYIMAQPNRDRVLRSRGMIDCLPVLINGDDILFRASQPVYSAWEVEIRKVGFLPSVGKNFRHPRFFTVNSVPLEYRRAPSPKQFWSGWSWADIEESTIPFHISQVPSIQLGGFLNVGLLTGQAKLTGRESLGALPLSGWHAGSVLSALNPPQAHNWFLKYHIIEIRRQTRHGSTTLNLFAHPLLGGLGFQVPSGVEPRFSPAQRRLARALFLSALHTYEGQEKDFSLDSLIFLESESAGTRLIGRKPRRVEIELYPTGTPLPEGYEPFLDSTGVSPIAMAQAVDKPESTEAKVKCRLSSSRIRQLTRAYGQVVDLHPLDKMSEFPFFPVRVHRHIFDQVASASPSPPQYVRREIQSVYTPLIPFQDVSVPTHEPVMITVSSQVEDWENQEIKLVLPFMEDESPPLVYPPPPLVRSTAVALSPSASSIRLSQSRDFLRAFSGYESDSRASRPFDFKWSRKGGRRW